VTSSYLTEEGILIVLRLYIDWKSSFGYLRSVSGMASLMALASSLMLELDGIIDVSK
jgi:hypothetical protein